MLQSKRDEVIHCLFLCPVQLDNAAEEENCACAHKNMSKQPNPDRDVKGPRIALINSPEYLVT